MRSIAGHDSGGFFAVLSLEGPCALICDGRRRPLEKPKRKKLLHLAPTAAVLAESSLQTNKALRAGLHPFNFGQGRES